MSYARVTLQQIASSKSRPTVADERLLLGIYRGQSVISIASRSDSNAAYGFGYGAPNALFGESLGCNEYRSVLLYYAPLSGMAMGMASATRSIWRRGGKVDLAVTAGEIFDSKR